MVNYDTSHVSRGRRHKREGHANEGRFPVVTDKAVPHGAPPIRSAKPRNRKRQSATTEAKKRYNGPEKISSRPDPAYADDWLGRDASAQ